ncbi:MAG: N-6 DNA methylase, partial [Nanobdellota archaeon]
TGQSKLKQYDLGHKWKKNKEDNTYEKDKLKTKENPQILFLERCLQLLRDGGKMGIILPETYFHGPSVKYIIKYLEERHNIFAVVDLPHNTFRPNCNAKTLVLFVEKGKKQVDEVIFGVVEEMGHNHQGKPIYRYDEHTNKFTKEIWDDTVIVSEEFKNPNDKNNKYVFTVKKEDINNSIYVPRYYWDKKIKSLEEDAKKKGMQFVSVKELIDKKIIKKFKGHGSPPSEYKGRGDVFYVRAGDVVDWDIYKNPTSAIPYEIYISSKGNGVDLKEKDIVFVKEGSYRVGDVAILSDLDTNILLNHHSLVFRVINEENKYGIDAFYLLYLFSHEFTKKQLYNKVLIDTTLPNIGDRWLELKLPVLTDKSEREKIKSQLKKVFKEKWETQKSFEKIKHNLMG